MGKRAFRGAIIGLALAAAGAASANCAAAILDLGLSQVFSANSVAPASPITPWVDAKFSDNGDGTVNLTLSNPNLTGVENVADVYLNFIDNSPLLVKDLSFSIVGKTGTFNSSALSYSLSSATSGQGSSSQKADGDGYFDIVINGFATGSDTTKTFGVGDTLVLKISSSQGAINVSDFDFTSDNGKDNFFAAAHIMNTPNSPGANSAWLGCGSAFVAAPEARSGAAAGLLALGSIGWLGFRRWRTGRLQVEG